MSPEHHRSDRVAESIREEVATFLAEGAKDPRLIAIVTVTAVECTHDLRQAKIFVSVMGTDAERASSLDALASMTGHLRSRVARALGLRNAPTLSFKLDESIARAARIESLLAEVREKKSGDDGAGS
jgi:ribosome-binding factor A